MSMFCQLFIREIKLSLHQGGDFAASLAFFLLPPFLFALGVGDGGAFDLTQGLAMILLTTMLALIASFDRLLRADWVSGWFDILRLRPPQLILAVWAKIAAFTILVSLPMILLSPVILKFLYAQPQNLAEIYALAPILLLFALNLTILGLMIAALGVSARQASILVFILLLPLSVPLFIFTLSACRAVLLHQDCYPPVAALVAFLMVAATVCPVLTAYVIKHLD